MKYGEIVDKDHLMYRVDFKKLKLIWIPHHWVAKIPTYKNKFDG